MRMHRILVALFAAAAAAMALAGSNDAWQFVPRHPVPTDHSTFFEGPFEDGPSVTRACLKCHPKAASDIMQTAHWNLVGDEVLVPGHDEPMRIGKRNLINNFCIGIRSNWPGCTSCHIGFGWEDDTFDLTDESLVDCLVCHEQTGTYRKKAGDAGRPAPDVDLLASARSVGLPTRGNCGACHFLAGGGDAVKHGDLDESLLFPNPDIDVHMGKLDFHCIDCHQAEDHLPPGRLLTVSVDNKNRLFCADCHRGDEIHGDRRIDEHAGRVACQTCHIPFMAGQDLPITDEHQYLKIKGRFTWLKGAQPEYAWYNGTGTRYLLGDKINPRRVTDIAAPLGDKDDQTARLHPFKIHRGKQVYDTVHNHFILPHTFGDKGFWTQFDWDEALRIGTEVTGLPYSGEYDFARTRMYLPQNHMVTPKEMALQCPDCHGPAGRMHWGRLGYKHDPLRRPMIEHEAIPLLDADGELVHESENPLSMFETCSQCHEIEEDFEATHAYHAGVATGDLPPERRALIEQGPHIPDGDGQQMNCFLCHLERPNYAEWRHAKQSDQSEWALAATLIGTKVTLKGGELLERTEDGYRWKPDALDADELAVIPMVQPRPEHCGHCHGLVHTGSRPLTVEMGSDEHWATETTGEVFSAQRINQSALNLRNKDKLGRAWDIHAQRLVGCRACHYAKQLPEQLRAADDADETVFDNGPRDCASCHIGATRHDWLPEREKHFAALSCEVCHIPQVHLPARQQVDASVITQDGEYLVSYRGLAQGRVDELGTAYVFGYRPLLIKEPDAAGSERWVPVNLISRWYWVDAADGESVSKEQLQQAWLEDGRHRARIVTLFDTDGDGRLQDAELRLDNTAKVQLVTRLLIDQGIKSPQLRARVDAHHLHHNVTLKEARRDCRHCHDPQEGEVFTVADYLPGNLLPGDTGTANVHAVLQRDAYGRLVLPRPAAISTSKAVPTEEH